MEEKVTSTSHPDEEIIAYRRAITLMRWTVAVVVGAHGLARVASDAVYPFGQWLETQGMPYGLQLAWAVTITEIAAAALLMINRLIVALVPVLLIIYAIGIYLVHAPVGWFVVGLGRNGSEFSALLICALITVWLPALARRTRDSRESRDRPPG
jgi:putative oxidoreductase